MEDIRSLLAQLVSFESISPQDAGCQEFMIAFFERHGFTCQRFNNPPVANFFARLGETGPLLIFAGHTDVVSPGDIKNWDSPPFLLSERNGLLYGRGTADMKGSLAAMMFMAAQFADLKDQLQGSLGFLMTSGEEGDDFMHGTPYVMAKLKELGINPDYCIVGEPSSSLKVGDVIKIGRRGSLTGKVHLQGKQGHVAYPHLASNPIHLISPVLTELIATEWDQGNEYFPPTSLQITQLTAGGKGNNIIPGGLLLHFNFRYSTEQTAALLQEKVLHCFEKHQVFPQLEWQRNGEPFLTNRGRLLDSCRKVIAQLTQQEPELSTTGGTSDGRFISPYEVEVVELGPVNATIHQVNEQVSLRDLELLYQMYYEICVDLLTSV